MDISVVIPAFNERDSIARLLEEVSESTAALPVRDIVLVDDGSSDGTADVAAGLKPRMANLRLLRLEVRSGQSAATRVGIAAAAGQLIVTLDADGQNDPAGISVLHQAYLREARSNGRVMIAGQRRKRQDDVIRRISSRIANAVRAWLLDDGVRDTGCSLKLFRRSDFLDLPYFDHIHRFIPALMRASGVRIVTVDVAHRPRERGVSKYGTWDRLWVGIHDLVGVRWLISRMRTNFEFEER